jgi:hypothetical protein
MRCLAYPEDSADGIVSTEFAVGDGLETAELTTLALAPLACRSLS